jgi:hypothetical protein
MFVGKSACGLVCGVFWQGEGPLVGFIFGAKFLDECSENRGAKRGGIACCRSVRVAPLLRQVYSCARNLQEKNTPQKMRGVKFC